MISLDQRHRLRRLFDRWGDVRATQGAMVTEKGQALAVKHVDAMEEEIERYLDFLESGEYPEETT